MPQAELGITMLDYGRESSRFTIKAAPLTVVTLPLLGAAIAAMEAAIAGISGGTITRHRFLALDDAVASDPPADPVYQRENKWTVMYEDTTTHDHFRIEIPCANLSLLSGHQEDLDVTSGPGLAFKTAFQTFAVSPQGNAVSIERIHFTGHNL